MNLLGLLFREMYVLVSRWPGGGWNFSLRMTTGSAFPSAGALEVLALSLAFYLICRGAEALCRALPPRTTQEKPQENKEK